MPGLRPATSFEETSAKFKIIMGVNVHIVVFFTVTSYNILSGYQS